MSPRRPFAICGGGHGSRRRARMAAVIGLENTTATLRSAVEVARLGGGLLVGLRRRLAVDHALQGVVLTRSRVDRGAAEALLVLLVDLGLHLCSATVVD